MEWFLFWLILAILVGAWASSRGRSGFGYFVLAVLLSPLIGALIVAIVGPKQKNLEQAAIQSGAMRKCPACAELVRAEATKCRYCGTSLLPQASTSEGPYV